MCLFYLSISKTAKELKMLPFQSLVNPICKYVHEYLEVQYTTIEIRNMLSVTSTLFAFDVVSEEAIPLPYTDCF